MIERKRKKNKNTQWFLPRFLAKAIEVNYVMLWGRLIGSIYFFFPHWHEIYTADASHIITSALVFFFFPCLLRCFVLFGMMRPNIIPCRCGSVLGVLCAMSITSITHILHIRIVHSLIISHALSRWMQWTTTVQDKLAKKKNIRICGSHMNAQCDWWLIPGHASKKQSASREWFRVYAHKMI